jgi:hypothetical protein
MTLKDYLAAHTSKKQVYVSYEESNGIETNKAEEFTLIYDRLHDKVFISLPNSKKREEVS